MMSSTRLTRRCFLHAASGTAGVLAGGLAKPAIAQPAKVRYTLSWLPTGQYAFLYCARQLGYFKQRGIEVDIARGYGSMAAIQAVATGQFEMGGAQTGANLLSILKGLDLRLLGTQGYDATLGVLAVERGPVKTPKDLEGRKIGVSAAGGDTPFLPAYCRLAGVDFGKVTVVQLDSKILEQSAMSGVVDAIVVTGLSSIPNFVSENVPFRMMPFSQAGLQFYWVNTITTGSFLAKNQELADNMQMAILDGMKFMLLNPQEAMERHLKEHEELALGKNGRLYVELGLGMTRAIMAAPESMQHGVGYTDLAKIDEQAKVVKQYAAAPKDRDPPKAETFCSNNAAGKVTLTPAQWDEVRSSTQKYMKLLGKS
ncbi:MAG TPA: ABC transporter substrate-binding protein [Xanthobacteraceae bacterium]|jgi:ABC-type nitrate/sulfonate/bicarbonate transport system substrate-binding protein